MFAFTKILNIVVRRCQWFLLAGMFFSHHLNHLKQRCRRCSWVKQRSSLLVCMPLGIRSRALSQYSLKRHLDKLCVLYYFTFFNFLFTILSILTFWWQHSMQYLGCMHAACSISFSTENSRLAIQIHTAPTEDQLGSSILRPANASLASLCLSQFRHKLYGR